MDEIGYTGAWGSGKEIMFIGELILFFIQGHHFITCQQQEQIIRFIAYQSFDGGFQGWGLFYFHSSFPETEVPGIKDPDPAISAEYPEIFLPVQLQLNDDIGRDTGRIAGNMPEGFEAGAIKPLQAIKGACPDITISILQYGIYFSG